MSQFYIFYFKESFVGTLYYIILFNQIFFMKNVLIPIKNKYLEPTSTDLDENASLRTLTTFSDENIQT